MMHGDGVLVYTYRMEMNGD